MENIYVKYIYVKFDGMVYQQRVGIPRGTNCASLIADYFFILLWEGLYDWPLHIQTSWPNKNA